MSLWELLKKCYQALPNAFQKKAVIAVFLLVIQSFAELLTFGAIIPAVPAFTSPYTFFSQGLGARIAAAVSVHSPIALSFVVLLGILLLFSLKNLLVHAICQYQTSFVFDLYCDLSTRLFRHTIGSGLLALRAHSSSDTARDIIGVTMRFSRNVVLSYLFLLTEAVVVLVLSCGIILYEPKAFLLVAGLLTPPFAIFYLRIKRLIQRLESEMNVLESDLSKVVYQTLFGYTDVVATGTQKFFLRKFSSDAEVYSEISQRRTVLGLVPTRIAELSLVVGVAALYLYSFAFIPDVPQRVALFTVYMIAAYRILPSANRITLCLLSIRGNAFSLETAQAAKASERQARMIGEEQISFHKHIQFEEVEFTYPGGSKPTLKNLNVTIQKGECVGVVGPSGSGKSTFLNLLLGLFEPTGGTLRIDDTPLSAANIESWRHKVGYVQQEVFIADGTVQDNIAFGIEKDKINRERLDRAMELSALTELVRALPAGIQTPLGERGSSLSVGQKQRVGIARALYHGAEVIVFDEATSALDAETEKEITASVQKLRQIGCSIVMVSHRDQPLTACDRILMLEGGSLKIRVNA